MLELVSIHIPKTGGSSLLRLLQRKYRRSLRLVYPPPDKPVWAKLRFGASRLARNLLSAPFPRCVHGHMPAVRYAATDARMIVFVRDPVEQRISTYHFARRQYAKRGVVANDEWRAAIELEEPRDFLAVTAPVYSRFLGGVPLERFSFVGAMDSFEDDLRRLGAWLDVSHVPERVNANPHGSDYAIPDEWRAIYARANPGEIELYQQALEHRRRLMEAR